MYFGLLGHAATLNILCVKHLAIIQRPLTVYFINFMKMNKKTRFQIIFKNERDEKDSY